jgi:hypothetical protein
MDSELYELVVSDRQLAVLISALVCVLDFKAIEHAPRG